MLQDAEAPEWLYVARDDGLEGACLGCRQQMEAFCFKMKRTCEQRDRFDLLCAACHKERKGTLSNDDWSTPVPVCLSDGYRNNIKESVSGVAFMKEVIMTFPAPTKQCYKPQGERETALLEQIATKLPSIGAVGDALTNTLVGEYVRAYNTKYGTTTPKNHGERISKQTARKGKGRKGTARELTVEHVQQSTRYIHGALDGFEGVQAFAHAVELLKEVCSFMGTWDLKDTMYFISGTCHPKKIPTGTGFHLDQTRGVNVAFDMENNTVRNVLALWLFLSPTILSDVDNFIREGEVGPKLKKKWEAAGGFSLPPLILDGDVKHGETVHPQFSLPVLTAEEMKVIHDKFPETTVLVEQYHGDVVFVPPGWVHAVTNVKANWKLARDFFIEEEYPLYAFFLKTIGSRIFGQRMPADYSSLDKKCKDFLQKALGVSAGCVPDVELRT